MAGAEDAGAEDAAGEPEGEGRGGGEEDHGADDFELRGIGGGAVHHDEGGIEGDPGEGGGEGAVGVFGDEHHGEHGDHEDEHDDGHVVLGFFEGVADAADGEDEAGVEEVAEEEIDGEGGEEVRVADDLEELAGEFGLGACFIEEEAEEHRHPGADHGEADRGDADEFAHHEFAWGDRGEEDFDDAVGFFLDGIIEEHLGDAEDGDPEEVDEPAGGPLPDIVGHADCFLAGFFLGVKFGERDGGMFDRADDLRVHAPAEVFALTDLGINAAFDFLGEAEVGQVDGPVLDALAAGGIEGGGLAGAGDAVGEVVGDEDGGEELLGASVDVEAAVAAQVGFELFGQLGEGSGGVDVGGGGDPDIELFGFAEGWGVVAEEGFELGEDGVLAAFLGEEVEGLGVGIGELVEDSFGALAWGGEGFEVGLGLGPGGFLGPFEGVFGEGLEDLALVEAGEAGVDDGGELAGLVDEEEVAGGGGLSLEEAWDHAEEQEHGGEEEEADPEAFGAGVLDEFAAGDEEGVFHRKRASRPSGPTRCMKTSWRLGSTYSKRRSLMPRAKQVWRRVWGSTCSRSSRSQSTVGASG